MAGPRIVKDFEFPSSFGFSGSATDRSTVMVRPHERAKPQRFARGGKVRKQEGGLVEKAKKFFGMDDKEPEKQVAEAPPQTPPPKATPPPAPKDNDMSIRDLVGGKRRRQEEQELGLKRGGKVKHKVKKFHGASFPAMDFEDTRPVPMPDDPDDVTAPALAKGGHFIKKAIKHPGAFKAKAKKAGMSTSAFAAKVTKPGSKASIQTKRQGNLAKTLAHLRPHAHGGKVRRAMGGPVKAKDGGEMRKIAKDVVKEHVNYPAPKGHKGLRKC